MSDIVIRRTHSKTLDSARAMADYLISELKSELDIDYCWEGDVMYFKRPGVAGEFALEKHEIIVNIRLGLVFAPLKPSIESAINAFFDEALAPRSAQTKHKIEIESN